MPRVSGLRDEAPLPDDAVLVRLLRDTYADGRLYDRDVLIADATVNFTAYGWYGLSLWAVAEAWSLDRLLQEKGRRAGCAALYTAAALRDRGLGLVPGGREPHYDANVGEVDGRIFGSVQIVASGVEDLVDRFIGATYTVVDNKYYVEELD